MKKEKRKKKRKRKRKKKKEKKKTEKKRKEKRKKKNLYWERERVTNNQQRQTNSKKHPEKNLRLSNLFVPSHGKKEEQTQENGNKNQIIRKKKKGIRGNGVVQKGTTKEGKRRKEGEANNKQEREPWRNSRFICRCPRMFFVCFAILS